MTWSHKLRNTCITQLLSKQYQMPDKSHYFVIFSFVCGVALTFIVSYGPVVLNVLVNRATFYSSKANNVIVYEGCSNCLSEDKYSTTRFERQLRKTATSELTSEALAALNQAVEQKKRGRINKAMKLFQHALVLDPTHADVLTTFGEFLELEVKDLVLADQMYRKALQCSPGHTKALQNRQRTLPLVEEIDQTSFDRIDGKRRRLYQVPESHPGLKRCKKESYFEHIHHSAAIEGNTLTLAQTRSIVETQMAVAGKSVMEHNEILGLDAALSYVNKTLVNRLGPLTWGDVTTIHHRVMGHVDPINAGVVRTTQVFVGDFEPPPAAEISALADEFIEWINSKDVQDLDPIEVAALVHYKFVYIHPFYDGNGRTSRLLMNLVLMRAGYPPVIVRKEHRAEYYRTLQVANEGDVKPFIRFIAYCTEQTIDKYLVSSVENYGVGSYRKPVDDGRTIIIDSFDDESNETVDSGG